MATARTNKPAKPKYGKLDGKPPSRPRGRHAGAHSASDEDDAHTITTLPVNRRLGFRVAEFAALIGVSNVSVWRGIKSGKIDVVNQAGIKIIPRSYAIKAGFITADDDG